MINTDLIINDFVANLAHKEINDVPEMILLLTTIILRLESLNLKLDGKDKKLIVKRVLMLAIDKCVKNEFLKQELTLVIDTQLDSLIDMIVLAGNTFKRGFKLCCKK